MQLVTNNGRRQGADNRRIIVDKRKIFKFYHFVYFFQPLSVLRVRLVSRKFSCCDLSKNYKKLNWLLRFRLYSCLF